MTTDFGGMSPARAARIANAWRICDDCQEAIGAGGSYIVAGGAERLTLEQYARMSGKYRCTTCVMLSFLAYAIGRKRGGAR